MSLSSPDDFDELDASDGQKSVSKVALASVMDHFVMHGAGRTFNSRNTYPEWFNVSDRAQVRMVFEIILERIPTASLLELSRLFDFVNDFPSESGGRLDVLYYSNIPDLPLKAIHRALLDRLLLEQPTALEGAGFNAFDRLYARAVFGDMTVMSIPTPSEKIKHMIREMQKLRNKPYFSS